MPAAAPIAPQHAPRRARYLIPRGTPRRGELIAALTVAALLAGALLAPLTLAAAAAFHAVSKLTHWRFCWLLAPAGLGLVWVVAAGTGGAIAGFGAGPSRLLSLLGHAVTSPVALTSLGRVPAVVAGGISGQFPVALVPASGIAAAAWWLDWLHTNEWERPSPRPGLVSAVRRRWHETIVKSGGVLTRQGACLGTDAETGRLVALSWQEAAGGVLVTGADRGAVRAGGFQLAHAAIRRRMPAVVVDLAGAPGLAGELAAACAAAGAPLLVFSAEGGGSYEPVRGTGPARAAAMITGMINWGDTPAPARRAGQDWLTEALTLLAAVPADPHAAALDLLAALLRPRELRAYAEQIPAYHPDRAIITKRIQACDQWLAADPATAKLLASELTAVRAGALGRRLGPGQATGTPINLDAVLSQRAVALFSLDAARNGRAAAMIANLVALDLAGTWAQQRELGFPSDGFAWIHGCDEVDEGALAHLCGAGRRGPLVTVADTTSPATATRLLGQAGAWVAHRVDDAGLAGQLAALTGTKFTARILNTSPLPAAPSSAASVSPPPSAATTPLTAAGSAPPLAAAFTAQPVSTGVGLSPVVPDEVLREFADGEFALVTGLDSGRPRRVVARGVAVTARVPPPAARLAAEMAAAAGPGAGAGPSASDGAATAAARPGPAPDGRWPR
jgi:hypothetical protein